MNKASFTVEDDIRRMQDEVFQLRLHHVVLVEGKSDEPFWERILERVIPSRFKIYSYVNFPTERSSSKSTLTAHYLPYSGRDLIFCLDSDYDYLLNNPNLRRPFVFQTYLHSVENFLCYSPSLANILALGTRTAQANFDFERFFSRYSESVHDWLICQLYFKQTNQVEIESPPAFDTLANPEEELIALKQQIDSQTERQLSTLGQEPDFQNFVRGLAALGLTPQSAYLFVRGHDLFERVTLKLLKKVAEPIIENEFLQLNNEEKAAYSAYQKQNAFAKLLYQNSNMDDCPFYERVVKDVRSAFA
jgi:hypothetical protein